MIRLALKFCKFHECYTINLFGYHLKIPFFRPKEEPEGIMESWGFEYFMQSMHFNWKKSCKIFHMPWEWKHIKEEILLINGQWMIIFNYVDRSELAKTNRLWKKYCDYSYILNSGIKQKTQAIITVERRTWCWKWLIWLGFPRVVHKSINVKFSSEIGEKTGSWKGGVLECGYEILPNETPELALRRMEFERRFN